MKIAVTGASGHVGANLVRTLLGQGHEVRAYYHEDSRALGGLALELAPLDVTDGPAVHQAVDGADVVFHLAARISIRGRRDQALVHRVNVDGVRHVVEACRRHRVGRLVHFSSIHALRGDLAGSTVDEETELALHPKFSGYDRSKAEGEKVVLDAVAQGLDAVIVNPTSILGPCDFKPSAQGKALLGICRRPLLPLVRASYNWVDVRDVVAGALLALERGRRGERYILGNLHLTFAEIAAHMARVTGTSASRLALPLGLLVLAVPFARLWSAISRQRQLLTLETIRILTRHRNVCCDKARRELGYAPRPFPETIAETFAWYGEAGLLPRRFTRALAAAPPPPLAGSRTSNI